MDDGSASEPIELIVRRSAAGEDDHGSVFRLEWGWSRWAHRSKIEPQKAVSPAKRTWDGVRAFAATQVREARRAPVTLALVLILWVVGAITGSLLNGPSESLLLKVGAGVPALQDGPVVDTADRCLLRR